MYGQTDSSRAVYSDVYNLKYVHFPIGKISGIAKQFFTPKFYNTMQFELQNVLL